VQAVRSRWMNRRWWSTGFGSFEQAERQAVTVFGVGGRVDRRGSGLGGQAVRGTDGRRSIVPISYLRLAVKVNKPSLPPRLPPCPSRGCPVVLRRRWTTVAGMVAYAL